MADRRLFFALWPDDAVRQALFHWQTQNLPADVRWQHRADLHMTLHFLGATAEARVQGLVELGARVAVGGFSLVLDEIGHWPRPKVLWAAPSSPPGELLALHTQLGEGLKGLGFAPERRPYRPHVTLARKVRKMSETQALSPLNWPVRELALVETRPGDAPHYRPVARWALMAGPAPAS